MPNTRQIIEQIIEVRERRHSDLATLELFRRLLSLQTSYHRRPQDNQELLRHYPVALVACMEAFFRLAIKEIVDSREEFLRNADKLAPAKLDFELVRALHGREISLGDLVAHVVSVNNLAGIAGVMSSLLGIDYLAELAAVLRATVDRNTAPEANRRLSGKALGARVPNLLRTNEPGPELLARARN